MGTPTHVPWISFLGPGMSTSNGYYPVYLFYKKENILVLAYGISETVKSKDTWNYEIHNSSQKISDFIDNPFRYGDSYVYKHYVPKIENDSVRYFIDEQEIDAKIISNDLETLLKKYKNFLDIAVKDESSDLSKGLFYMEQQLEDFMIENWDNTEFGKKYDLIVEDGELKSQQYRTSIGNIDILAVDRVSKDYVVIELKRNQTSDDTIGQVTRYMGWVLEYFQNENVRGVIVAGKFDNKLFYAQKVIKNVEVFLYEVGFRLNEYKKN
tara:strand:- start:148 stop:948 length:801 start_codon:yes stop_codon:yes gene_type:complete